jgi:repressor LexA
VRDIVKGCGLRSTSVAQYHLGVLERQGFIQRSREISRSITVSRAAKATAEVPVLGVIAAGDPIPVPSAEDWHVTPEESLEVPVHLLQGK